MYNICTNRGSMI